MVPLTLTLAVMVSGVALAVDVDRLLADKVIAEGTGIEHVLTVYDDSPRIFASLGEPTETGGDLYLYKGKGSTLVIQTTFSDGKHRVTTLTVSGTDPRIHTEKGVHLLDQPDRVIALLGDPAERSDSRLGYPGLGVSFALSAIEKGGPAVVTGIEVRRPVGEAPAVPVAPPTALPVPSGGLDFSKTGLFAPLTERWIEVEPIGPKGGLVRSFSGSAEVRVAACQKCKAEVEAQVLALEKELGPNRISEAKQRIDEVSRVAMGIDNGYAGVYGKALTETPRWLLALRSGQRTWLVTIALLRPAEPEIRADIVALLRAVRVLAPSGAPTP